MASSWDDDAWDEICTNAHRSFIEEGRESGRIDGLEAGYSEGYEIGCTTALDYGMEIGFMKGVVELLRQRADWLDSKPNRERIIKTLGELEEAIQRFPTPEQLLRRGQTVEGSEIPASNNDTNPSSEDLEDEATESSNVRVLLQRIRAKFKVLTVQLGMPHFSLKQVFSTQGQGGTMDDAHARSRRTSPPAIRPIDNEW